MRKLTACALGAATLALAAVSSASAQQAQLRQRSTPAPNPALDLQQGPIPAGQEQMTCKGVQVYVTLRGVAFACADFQAGTVLTMVLDNRQFSQIENAAMPMLMEAAAESRPYILNPQVKGTQLYVRYRAASAHTQAICNLVGSGIKKDKCREIIHVYK